MTASGKHGEMLANAGSGRARGDRLELTADVRGGVRLQVEAVLLGQSAGEENVDHGPRRVLARCGGPQRVEVVHAEAEQPDSSGLQGGAGRDGMLERLGGGMSLSHGIPPCRAARSISFPCAPPLSKIRLCRQ